MKSGPKARSTESAMRESDEQEDRVDRGELRR